MSSSIHLLQTRLKEVSASLNEIKPLINRLSNFTHAVGQGDEARLELGAEIHSRLKIIEEESELLNVEVEVLEGAGSSKRKTSDNSEKETEKKRVIGLVAKLTTDLKKCVLFR
jgi:prefoldin subunit 5